MRRSMSRLQVFDIYFTVQEEGRRVDQGHLVLHASDRDHAERKAKDAIWAGLQRLHLPLERITVGIHEAKVVA